MLGLSAALAERSAQSARSATTTFTVTECSEGGGERYHGFSMTKAGRESTPLESAP